MYRPILLYFLRQMTVPKFTACVLATLVPGESHIILSNKLVVKVNYLCL